jgi:hypothetical protein
MSTPTPSPIMFWHYPDTFEKMVMNDLVSNNSISKRKFQAEEFAVAMEWILDMYEANGYVTSANRVDPVDGLTHKTWTVTPFFLSRIQAQRDRGAEQDVIKMALWNQKNQLMASAAQKSRQVMRARGAVAAPMDVNMDETESDIHDRIRPELDALKKKMQDELLAKKKRRLDEEGKGDESEFQE